MLPLRFSFLGARRVWRSVLERVISTWVIVVFVASAGAPVAVQAQMPTTNLIQDPIVTQEKIQKEIQKPLGVALVQILVNLISFVSNRLAYDAAMAIASGGKGQGPNFEYRTPEEYWKSVGEDIAGEAIGVLQQNIQEIGINFDVCAPRDPQVRLSIQLGIAAGPGSHPRQPKCNFSSIKSNWEGFVERAKNAEHPNREVLSGMASMFSPGATDFDAALSIVEQTANRAAKKQVLETDKLNSNKGFKGVEDFITGNTKTPAAVLEDQFTKKLDKAQNNQSDALQQALFSNEGALLQIGVSAGSVFLNTLLSQLTNKIYSGLFNPPAKGGVWNPEFVNVGGRELANETLKGLFTTSIDTIDQYNVVNQFVTCPGATTRSINNCVLDTPFAAAIARAGAGSSLTVREAINANLLHANWPLISSRDEARNTDPFCYTYGYCHANLVKLRAARILPIGWELAAESASNQEGSPVTLRQVVDGFYDCNWENPNQLVDSEHPWCHLVDPNWVIAYPETMCRAQVPGQMLLAANADVRAQTCVDAPSCIAEDEQGNCVGGYGYCLREENTWRFGGDQCPVQFASCVALASREGAQVSYLTNTVDYADCDASNAGCKWYRTAATRQDGEDALPDNDDDIFVFENNVSALGDRLYMNAQAQSCSVGDSGCTAVVLADTDETLNMVANPNFEEDGNEDDVPDGWVLGVGATLDTQSSHAAFNDRSIVLSGGGEVELAHPFTIPSQRFVSASVYQQQVNAGDAMQFQLRLYTTSGEAYPITNVVLPPESACEKSYVPAVGPAEYTVLTLDETLSNTFTRVGCTFSLSLADTPALAEFHVVGNGRFDAVQVEENEIPTAFHESYAPNMERVAMKIAPAYLGCTGDATDHPLCENYAQVCSAAEVGCKAYAPANGDPTVPGIVSANDACPTECVNYETHRQLATNFSIEQFPLYFIASTARACQAQYVGCEEFTDTTSASESRAYFADRRACQTVAQAASSNSAQATYYTWEGADVAGGYQIKTWTLKKSNLSNAPCVDFDQVGGNCVETAAYVAPTDCDAHNDLITNPDCREFIDSLGAIHYRLYSETISVTDQCHGYRKTTSSQAECSATGGVWNAGLGSCNYFLLPSESRSCPAAQNGCRAYVGNTGSNMRLVADEAFEDGNLNAWPTVFGGTPVYSNESLANGGHSMRLPSLGTRVRAMGTRGQFTDGYTYTVQFWAKGQGSIAANLYDDTLSHRALTSTPVTLSGGWQPYTIGPIQITNALGVNLVTTALTLELTDGSEAYVDNVVVREVQSENYLIAGSWVTPSTCNQTPQGVPAPQFFLGCRAYQASSGERVALKSFSSLCREQAIGCSAVYDTQNSASTFGAAYGVKCDQSTAATSPTACTLNGTEVCTILPGQSECRFNWEEGELPIPTSSPTTFQGSPLVTAEPDSVVVPPDQKLFLVDSPDARCGSGAVGCTLLGEPTFDTDNSTVVSFTDVAKLVLPDQFTTTLCASGDVFCEEYTSKTGTKYFFKNPMERTCEYRDRVVISGTPYSGWFQTGSDTPCDNTDGGYVIAGTQYGIWRNGDNATSQYEGFVGQCPAKNDQCAEFLDVADTKGGEEPRGTSYTFVKNDRILERNRPAAEKCEGQVSQEQGCVVFEDTSNPTFTMNASASYVKSRHADAFGNTEPFSRVTPVSCPDDGTLALTAADDSVNLCRKRCGYVLTTGYEASGNSLVEMGWGGSCMSNADCGTMRDDFGADRQGVCLDVAENLVTAESNPLSGVCLNRTTSFATCDFSSGSCEVVANDVVESCQPQTGNPQSTCSVGVCAPAFSSALTNDANTVVKVNKDRTCGEWLACDAQYTTWSAEQNRYVTVCESVDVCNEYTQVGDTSFCSNWPTTPEQVLTTAVYATRDVTWAGQEFSGFSIPGAYNVKDYDQVNVNPTRWCRVSEETSELYREILNSNGEATQWVEADADWNSGVPMECATETDCTDITDVAVACELAIPDYRLGVRVGPCLSTTADGEQCTVGHCAATGVQCAADSDCGTDAAADCVLVSASTQVGRCYDGQCMQTPGGNPLTRGNAYVNECRGYPEDTSPFPNEVVTEWNDPLDADVYDGSTVPRPSDAAGRMDLEQRSRGRKQGFAQAKICANGEACECSYKKVEYGSGARNLYTDLDGTDGNTPPAGICNGGPYDGFACTTNAMCQLPLAAGQPASGGMCEFKTTENTFVGWNGFCVERDGSMSILGNKDKSACLLWLPVDRLQGATDIYNKFTEAGFPITNTAYCTETKLYADLYVTGTTLNTNGEVETIAPACADSFRGTTNVTTELSSWMDFLNPFGAIIEQAISDSNNELAKTNPNASSGSAGAACEVGEWDNCWLNVRCPKGYFGIVGTCDDGGDDEGSCTTQSGLHDNDCPYICVPDGAVQTVPGSGSNDFALGQECEPPASSYPAQTSAGELVSSGETIAWPTQVWLVNPLIGNGLDYTEKYKNCVKKGVEWDDINADNLTEWAEGATYLPQFPENFSQGGSNWWRDFTNSAQFYLGCSEVAFASVEEGFTLNGTGNAAYTNRTLSQNSDQQFDMSDSNLLGYTAANTSPKPVGRVDTRLEALDSAEKLGAGGYDEEPVRLAACSGASAQLKTTETDTNVCAAYDAHTTNAYPKAYQPVSYSMPGGLVNNTCASDVDCTGSVTSSTGTATCLDVTASQHHACFIACDSFAMQYNPAVSPGETPDEFCSRVVAPNSTCILAPSNYTAATSGFTGATRSVCSHWYYDQTITPLVQNDYLSSSADTCALAVTNGVIPSDDGVVSNSMSIACAMVSLGYTGVVNGINMTTACNTAGALVGQNPFAWASYQCDGPASAGGDAACRDGHDEDCAAAVGSGGPGATCIKEDDATTGVCSLTTYAPLNTYLPSRVASPNVTVEQARGYLSQFFARIFAFWSFNDEAESTTGTGAYQQYVQDTVDLRSLGDEYGVDANDGTPTAPVIAAVTDVCTGEVCVEGANNAFSVNGSAGNVFEAERSFRADVRFYAWADTNQYPIRKVLVDWNDGMDTVEAGDSGSMSGSITNDNYYKAHRGLSNITQQPICTNDSDPAVEWGKTSDSCTSDPFQFTHHYKCTQGLLNWINSTGRLCSTTPNDSSLTTSGPCTFDGQSCVFQPRVYVEDNWGYCAGECTVDSEEVACFGTTPSALESVGMCDYVGQPGTNTSKDPWVYYNGYIQVAP